MSRKLTKKEKTSILNKIKDEHKRLPQILEEIGITDLKAPQARKQLVAEYGLEEFQKIMGKARNGMIPPFSDRVKLILENKGGKLTEEYCDKLADELEAAMEVVYLKKEELAD
jgi:hypothetical protein